MPRRQRICRRHSHESELRGGNDAFHQNRVAMPRCLTSFSLFRPANDRWMPALTLRVQVVGWDPRERSQTSYPYAVPTTQVADLSLRVRTALCHVPAGTFGADRCSEC